MSLISFLIPSRGRPEKLIRAVKSIARYTDLHHEIIIRVDSDDPTRDAAFKGLPQGCVIRVGESKGYDGLSEYYQECEREARSHWCMVFNDDATLEISNVRMVVQTLCFWQDKHIVLWPERMSLGASEYQWAHTAGFPIYPRECWKIFATRMPCPIDLGIEQGMLTAGATIGFIQGMKVIHDREVDDTLPKHRF